MNPTQVYLLTSKAAYLRAIRQMVESIGLPLVSCCSVNNLLTSCSMCAGIVLITAMEYSIPEVEQIIEKLRDAGHAHAVLVIDQRPTSEKALAWIRIPICDYFQFQMTPSALQTIFRNALDWSKKIGEREVRRQSLRRLWQTLDEGLKSVLRLTYKGLTNRDIARQLSISSRTVENRRAKLLEIFGVTSMVLLIRLAVEFMEEDDVLLDLVQK